MARQAGIIAYGTPEDRLRLAAIVEATQGRSGSVVVIDLIRARYAELFGDLDPKLTQSGDTQ